MSYSIKSKLTPAQVRKKYQELNEEYFLNGLLPLSCRVYAGAWAFPTKDGTYLIKHETSEVFTDEESIEGKRYIRLMKLKKLYEK